MGHIYTAIRNAIEVPAHFYVTHKKYVVSAVNYRTNSQKCRKMPYLPRYISVTLIPKIGSLEIVISRYDCICSRFLLGLLHLGRIR